MKQSAELVLERERETPLRQLSGDVWQVRHDVHGPGAEATADQVVVGPAGVFVVEVVAWDGGVTVHDRVLRHRGRPRHEVAAGLAAAAAAVKQMVPSAPLGLVQPVLCVAGPQAVSGWADGVHVQSAQGLVAWLESLPPILGPGRVDGLVAELEAVAEVQPGPRPGQVLLRSGAGEEVDAPARSGRVVRRWISGALVALAAVGVLAVPRPDVAGRLDDLGSGLGGIFGSAPATPDPSTGHHGAAVRQHAR
jgi:hypothetical protein